MSRERGAPRSGNRSERMRRAADRANAARRVVVLEAAP